jgi:hypothetical protein
MSEATAQKVGEAAQTVGDATASLITHFDQYLQAASDVMSKYGGDAAQLGLSVLRIEAAGYLLTGLGALIIAALAFYFLPKRRVFTPEEQEALIKKGYSGRSGAEDRIVAKITGSTTTSGNYHGELKDIHLLPDYEDITVWLRTAGCVVTLGISSVVVLINLFDVWTWIGLFWPEAYAVHKFLL